MVNGLVTKKYLYIIINIQKEILYYNINGNV